MTRLILLSVALATIIRPCLGNNAVTLPIPTFRLDLTIRSRIRRLRGAAALANNDGDLNDRGGDDGDDDDLGPGRALERDLDDAIRAAAEAHLSSAYSSAFPDLPPPSRVLLTVNKNDGDPAGGGGIYVRSSFVGGVVSFPLEGGSAEAPGRSELERATLAAFRIPGAGEPFLKALGDHPELEGLLVVSAEEVDARYDDDSYTSDNGPATTSQQTTQHDDGNNIMNIWAVAAVAALGAMFCVIVTCTSILYCDWRKRKVRREKKRERAMAQAAAMAADNRGRNGNGRHYRQRSSGAVSSKSSGKSDGSPQPFDEPPQIHLQSEALQIVVQSAQSGETEVTNTPSPSTQGSNEKDALAAMPSNSNNNVISGKGSMLNRIKSSRRSIGGSLPKNMVKSKAANMQLQDAAEASVNAPSSADYQSSADYAPEFAPSVTDHSVGEDTTMLYPTINRHRLSSKDRNGDNMSDFDGYSIDGMSAIVSGNDGYSVSAAGMSNEGASGLLKKRDAIYSGDVPRDFDSVWGDDDQSRITTDGSVDYNAVNMAPATSTKNKVKDSSKEAYGDLTKNLDELVERENEESSHSNVASVVSSAVGDPSTVNLHEFDSGSDSGSTNRGAFTLELLGKGGTKAGKNPGGGSGSATPSQDDVDSILGDMYKDETDDDDESANTGNMERIPSGGDSVDSTPSWAAPIQSALKNSVGNIFRASMSPRSADEDDKENSDVASNKSGKEEVVDAPTKKSQERRTKEKFVSSLGSGSPGSDDGSESSRLSYSSESNGRLSSGSPGIQKGKTPSSTPQSAVATAKSSEDRALGLTNSMEEEVDEDPGAMIDNINSMLSECRDILDTENAF